MSFWPFGQSLNSSNINKILDDYFKVLHTLEKSNPVVAKTVRQNFSGSSDISDDATKAAGKEVVSAVDINRNYESSLGGISSPQNANLQDVLNDSLTTADQRRISTSGSRPSIDSSSSRTRTSSFTSGSGSSETDSDEDDIDSATEPMTITIKNLSSLFIDKLLDESELLNELTRQNSTLLDFICFGFFYDATTQAIVQNIDYLIDLMIRCADKLHTANDETIDEMSKLTTDDDDTKLNAYPSNDNGENTDKNGGEIANKSKIVDDGDDDDDDDNNDDDDDDDEDDNDDENDNDDDDDDDGHGDDDGDDDGESDGHGDNGAAYNINSSDDDNRFVENVGTIIDDQDEPSSLSKATIVSEIFSLDIWLISESLVKNQNYLSKIWSILVHPKLDSEKSPLVPIFLKINQNLLITRQDQYLNFIRSRSSLVDDMLNHIEISLLMDFFLKCMATDKVEAPTGIIELVFDQDLIPKCLAFLNNEEYMPDIQACAGDFLKALIAISANAPLDDMSIGPNSLTRQLVSPEIIDNLVHTIIKKRGSALNITVSIVIELIRKNNSDYDQVNLLTTTIQSHPPSNRDPIYLGNMLREFAMELPDLFQIIVDAENCEDDQMLENQLQERYKPLGFERFKVVELIAELLHCSNMGLMNSKKAERINRERDNCRKQLAVQLQDALEELNIYESSNSDASSKVNSRSSSKDYASETKAKSTIFNDSCDDYDNDAKTDGKSEGTDNLHINAQDEANEDSSTMGHYLAMENSEERSPQLNSSSNFESSDEDVDESFEIPYVNENQSKKLRKAPTIGDLFKIKLYDTQVLPKIIELFLSHPWNNFWHNVIFDIIQQIFNGRMDFSYNSFLVYSLFNLRGSIKFMSENLSKKIIGRDFKMTKDLILKGYKDSYSFYEKRRTNLGYMGHLVLIAEEVVKFSKLYKVELISPDIHETLKDEEWIFYTENVLNDTRLMYSKILGGGNYVDDGNGNIIPQLTDTQEDESTSQADFNEDAEGGGLINVESLEEQLGLSTESDLHEKLRSLLIHNSEQEVEAKNKKNGVIILGPSPPEESIKKTAEDSAT